MPENYCGVNVKLIPVDTKEIQDSCQLCRFKDIPFSKCDSIPCTENDREDKRSGYFVEVKK